MKRDKLFELIQQIPQSWYCEWRPADAIIRNSPSCESAGNMYCVLTSHSPGELIIACAFGCEKSLRAALAELVRRTGIEPVLPG